MPSKPPICKVCGAAHWRYQPHVLPKKAPEEVRTEVPRGAGAATRRNVAARDGARDTKPQKAREPPFGQAHRDRGTTTDLLDRPLKDFILDNDLIEQLPRSALRMFHRAEARIKMRERRPQQETEP